MGLSRYIEYLVLTCLGWAPLLAVVTYKHACSKPCYYIHHVWTEKLPATTAAKLQLKNSSFLSRSPALISVENGGNFSALHPQGTWWGLMQTYPPILDSIWSASDTKEFPNPAHVNELVCETDNVRKQIEDNRDKGCATTVYLFVLVMWTLMKLAHDWALLADVAEDFTLPIDWLSWAFHLQESLVAIRWAAAATGVFVSRVPEGNGAWYYQLQPFPTLTALGAALLLLYFSHVKMNNLVLSLVNYYCKIFNVPYGAVKGIAASQPLLTKGLHGDSMFYLHLHHISSLNVETGKLAVSQAWSLAPVVFLKLATLLAAAATLVIGGALAASVLVTVIQEALSDWRSLRAIDKLTVSAQLLLSTALLLLALSTSGGAWNITQGNVCVCPWLPGPQHILISRRATQAVLVDLNFRMR
ncbi:unnamed protein product [Cladocopium goreaui]|uniref:Unconventional myosin-IXa n=1 Tax=Cladocopium goreaui TaxID=2562237 RepID=A0A9P1CQU5_9DINO|nr:unnamed protein product [Cladocopium goreaui]